MAKEQKIKSLYGTFTLVGTASIPKDKEKFVLRKLSDSKYQYTKVNFGIKTSPTNVVYLELMGGYSTVKKNKIYTFDTDKNKLEVDFADRNKEAIIERVADWKKMKGEFIEDGVEHVYISEFDFAEGIANELQADEKYYVTGSVTFDRYIAKDGTTKTNMKLKPQRITLAKEDAVEKAEMKIGFVFDKESLSTDRLEDEKKIDISAFTTLYDKSSEQNIFIPINFVINGEKVDFEDKESRGFKMFDYMKNCFKVKKGVYETEWICSIVRGAVEAEITYEDLSESQKIQVDMGMSTLEEIAKDSRGGKVRNKLNEIRLVRPTNKFEGKTVNEETDYTDEDFFAPEIAPKEEKLSDLEDKKSTSSPKDDVDAVEDLFA